MEFFNSLNLTQIKGGTKLKQGDLGSVLSYSLTDENGQEITSFDNKTAYINLVLDDKIWFTTTTLVDISRVTFHIDKAIPIGLYYLEIKIDDYIFPSDRDSIILIEEGSTPYDLKELVPNYDVNMTLKGILSDLSQKGIDISDLKRRIGNVNAQLAEKVNKDEVTNVMTPKGNIAYASLPTSGNQVGWYYYCPDGDGVHGAGNYVWNGSSWFFGGTGDEGYNLLKEDIEQLDAAVFDEEPSKNKKIDDVHYYAQMAKSGENVYIEPVSYNNWSLIYSVKPGQKFEVKTYCTTSDYLSGIVFLYSENLPQTGKRYKAIEFNNLEVTSNKYATGTVVVPDGANYMCIRDYGHPHYEEVTAYAKPYELVSKIPTKNEVHHIKQNIFNIKSVGSVNVGTLEYTGLCKNNNGLKVWKFNKTGKITFENVYVPKVSENDTLGIWIWCNQDPCSISDNLDGTFTLTVGEYSITKNIGYNMHNGWNYFVLDDYDQNSGEYTLDINFTLVRGNYEFVFDSFELNYRRKSHVLLSFDGFNYDNRVSILNEYDMVATVANIQNLSNENINELLAKGWDWAIYPAERGGGTSMPSYSGTVDEWVTHFKAIENYLATKGLMCPMTLFANTNRVNPVVNEALKKCGYRMARGGTSKQYIDSVDKTGMCVGYIGIGINNTANSILEKIDTAISKGQSICVFTHWVEDTVTQDYNCSTEVFRGVLDGIKDRVNANKCDVITFRELYSEFEPSDCMEFLEVRHEKEKQYILSKLTN